MTKILFLIHDLGGGGAEKVLVNLVNNMDKSVFDITVMSVFDVGVNRQFLSPDVKYIGCYPKMIPGNSKIMKLLSPAALHRQLIKEHYDIEVSYLEGPCARIISGCEDKNTKKVCWIHATMKSEQQLSSSFRNFDEAKKCYESFDYISFVSQDIEKAFIALLPDIKHHGVVYNTIESDKILALASESAAEIQDNGKTKLVTVGSLKDVKGYDRLLRIVKKLKDEGLVFELYMLGTGVMENELKNYISVNSLSDSVHMLGYRENPYNYVSKCDLFICSSYSEGFSTAATEALIVGTPVCTVDVSGMKEMLGEHNEYGIVTDNTEDALYEGIKSLLSDPELLAFYKQKAEERGKTFSTGNTVKITQKLFEALL